MGYWENLIDVYESWDHESLVEEAYQLSCVVRDDIIRAGYNGNALTAALMIAAYFMDADGMVDGDESTLIRMLFEDQPLDLSGDRIYASYKRYNWEPWVLDYLRNCSRSARENAVRFGIVVCSADGYIRESERRRILYWV